MPLPPCHHATAVVLVEYYYWKWSGVESWHCPISAVCHHATAVILYYYWSGVETHAATTTEEEWSGALVLKWIGVQSDTMTLEYCGGTTTGMEWSGVCHHATVALLCGILLLKWSGLDSATMPL